MGNPNQQNLNPGRTQSAAFIRTSGIVVRWVASRLGKVPGGHEWTPEASAWADGWEARGSDGDEMAPPIVIGELYSWLIDVNYSELGDGNPIEPLDGQQDFDKTKPFRWDPVPGAVDYKLTLKDKSSGNVMKVESTGGNTQWTISGLKDDHEYRWRIFAIGDDPGEKKKAFTVHFKTQP